MNNTFQRDGRRHVALLVGLLLLCGVASVRAVLSLDQQRAYARRFCPYLKTTKGEHEWLCNWDFLVSHATMVSDYVSAGDPDCFDGGSWDEWPDGNVVFTTSDLANNPSLLISPKDSDVREPDGIMVYPGYALHIGDADRNGENNSNAIYGCHGIYAHVEEVPGTQIINIEYTMLWIYNSATCDYHSGDMTTMVVQYDAGCDLLIRVTFLAHGPLIMSYFFCNPGGWLHSPLQGTDWDGNKVVVDSVKLYEPYYKWSNNNSDYVLHDLGEWVSMVQDPVTLRYEHPVVFAEENGHEFWPNETGKLCYWLDTDECANSHDGDGVSFLTTNVQVLGTPTDRVGVEQYDPFLFYGGKMGTATAAILFHNAWYWPEGRYDNPFFIGDFVDRDPYDDTFLPWPPTPEFAGEFITLCVDSQANPEYISDGTVLAPFPDLMMAYSFIPKGSTLSMAAGNYTTGPVTLSRACTIKATGGTVRIQ